MLILLLKPIVLQNKVYPQQWNIKSLMEKVLELQDLLLQAQEKTYFYQHKLEN